VKSVQVLTAFCFKPFILNARYTVSVALTLYHNMLLLFLFLYTVLF
jgi:hypothetical protein